MEVVVKSRRDVALFKLADTMAAGPTKSTLNAGPTGTNASKPPLAPRGEQLPTTQVKRATDFAQKMAAAVVPGLQQARDSVDPNNPFNNVVGRDPMAPGGKFNPLRLPPGMQQQPAPPVNWVPPQPVSPAREEMNSHITTRKALAHPGLDPASRSTLQNTTLPTIQNAMPGGGSFAPGALPKPPAAPTATAAFTQKMALDNLDDLVAKWNRPMVKQPQLTHTPEAIAAMDRSAKLTMLEMQAGRPISAPGRYTGPPVKPAFIPGRPNLFKLPAAQPPVAPTAPANMFRLPAAPAPTAGGMPKTATTLMTPDDWDREESTQAAHAKRLGLGPYKRTKIPKGHVMWGNGKIVPQHEAEADGWGFDDKTAQAATFAQKLAAGPMASLPRRIPGISRHSPVYAGALGALAGMSAGGSDSLRNLFQPTPQLGMPQAPPGPKLPPPTPMPQQPMAAPQIAAPPMAPPPPAQGPSMQPALMPPSELMQPAPARSLAQNFADSQAEAANTPLARLRAFQAKASQPPAPRQPFTSNPFEAAPPTAPADGLAKGAAFAALMAAG